jgi:hypothetical protein
MMSEVQSSIKAIESMYRARSYQLEMLEQSLAGNIIVAVLDFHESSFICFNSTDYDN